MERGSESNRKEGEGRVERGEALEEKKREKDGKGL